MLPTILGIAGIGFVSGLALLHWLTLAAVSLAGTIVFVLASPWDWLLLPKWFGLLTIYQLAYLTGAALQVWLAGRSQSEISTPVRSQDLQGERILIVEDEPLVAAVLAEEIEAASGQPVGPATSVAEALRIIEAEDVDAAVLDIKLVDGEVTPVALELIRRKVPFVILTGVRTPREITERRPAVPIFRKPIPASSPIRSLAEQIRRAGKPRKPALKAS